MTFPLKIKLEDAAAGVPSSGCEMCSNYELQLQSVQRKEDELRNQLARSQEIMQTFKDDLRKEQNNRAELEEKFNEDATLTDSQLSNLIEKLETNDSQLQQMKSM